MAKFVTVAYGLVTRAETSLDGLPPVTESDDAWIEVSGIIPTPTVGDHTTDNGQTFVYDRTSLSNVQGTKIAELRDKCAFHVKKKGFGGSSVLWADRNSNPPVSTSLVYPSMPSDQSNMYQVAISASRSIDPSEAFPLRCAIPGASGPWVQDTDSSTWRFRDHTAAGILSMAHNLAQHVQAAREFLENPDTESLGYVNLVLAATTIAEVNAIVWVGPSN